MSDSERQREFTNLLSQCQPRVMACIYALVHNMHQTEDIYQEACIVMWRKFDTYRPGSEFVKWACEIAYLEVMNHRRLKRTALHFSAECAEEFMAWERALPAGKNDFHVEALYACMEQLSEEDRRLLESRYWELKSVVEIAAELHRSPQSVCNSLSRIRARLMACIERNVSAEN